jgi:hypothetical protein
MGLLGATGAASLLLASLVGFDLAGNLSVGLVMVAALLVRVGLPGGRLVEASLTSVGWLPSPPDTKTRHALPPVERRALPEEAGHQPESSPWNLLEPTRCHLSRSGANAVVLGLSSLGLTALAAPGAPPAAVTLMAPLGLAAIATGLVSCSGGRSLQEWEAWVRAEEVRWQDRVPVDIRAVAATPLSIRAVTVSLWSVRHFRHGAALPPESAPASGYEERQVQVQVELGQRLESGQALRVLTALEIPPDAPVSNSSLGDRTDYYLRVDVDIPWRPDSYQVWRFLDVTDRVARRLPGADQVLLPASHDLEGLTVVCPYCGEPPGERPLVSCHACESLHHRDCWTEAEACTTYGCGEARSRQVLLVTPPQR